MVFESLEEQKQELIKKHLELVIQANQTVNLTRIDTLEEGITLHVEDSLSALDELNSAPDGLYGDLGSGGGFPGIPLAIAADRQAVLIDARKKKMDAVQGIIEELGLSDRIKTFAGRAELLAKTEEKKFSVLTARALSQLSVILELASPLLARGGQLICFKAHVEESELLNAHRVERLTGMQLLGGREFILGGEYTRTILVFEKRSRPAITLPRKEGDAQNNPL